MVNLFCLRQKHGSGLRRWSFSMLRDRVSNEDGSKIKYRSALVPPYLRKAKSVEELLPWLYLKGISTGDFSEALASLLGPDAEGGAFVLDHHAS